MIILLRVTGHQIFNAYITSTVIISTPGVLHGIFVRAGNSTGLNGFPTTCGDCVAVVPLGGCRSGVCGAPVDACGGCTGGV